MAITEARGKPTPYPIFREAANSFSGNDAVPSAKLTPFAFADCRVQDSRHVGLGYPDGVINDEEPNSPLIKAVIISLHAVERRAFGKANKF